MMGPIMLDLRKHDGRNANLRALAAMGYDLTIADGGYAVFTPPGLTLEAAPEAAELTARGLEADPPPAPTGPATSAGR